MFESTATQHRSPLERLQQKYHQNDPRRFDDIVKMSAARMPPVGVFAEISPTFHHMWFHMENQVQTQIQVI